MQLRRQAAPLILLRHSCLIAYLFIFSCFTYSFHFLHSLSNFFFYFSVSWIQSTPSKLISLRSILILSECTRRNYIFHLFLSVSLSFLFIYLISLIFIFIFFRRVSLLIHYYSFSHMLYKSSLIFLSLSLSSFPVETRQTRQKLGIYRTEAGIQIWYNWREIYSHLDAHVFLEPQGTWVDVQSETKVTTSLFPWSFCCKVL
jgi:hypothetical protein